MSAGERRAYHHGRSPAAWIGTIIAAVGFVLCAIAAMLQPKGFFMYFSVALIVAGLVVGLVMKKMGYGTEHGGPHPDSLAH